jgi:hypothetical protein
VVATLSFRNVPVKYQLVIRMVLQFRQNLLRFSALCNKPNKPGLRPKAIRKFRKKKCLEEEK